jgi:hypothetical protein
MRLFAYALLLFCIGLGLWFSGTQTVLSSSLLAPSNSQPTSVSATVAGIINVMFNPAFAISLLTIALGVGLLTGFSAVYVIPAVIFAGLANVVLLPSSMFMSCARGCTGGLPPEIQVPYFIFIQLLLYATIWEFIRGGG